MARLTEGPRSYERLYLNSMGEIVPADDPDRRVLVAAPGAMVDPQFRGLVTAYLEKQHGTDNEQQPAPSSEAPLRAAEAKGRAEVKKPAAKKPAGKR